VVVDLLLSSSSVVDVDLLKMFLLLLIPLIECLMKKKIIMEIFTQVWFPIIDGTLEECYQNQTNGPLKLETIVDSIERVLHEEEDYCKKLFTSLVSNHRWHLGAILSKPDQRTPKTRN